VIVPPADEDRLPCSLGLFPDDLSRALVVAEPEKARLPQPGVARPFGKSDLSDELGPRPVRSAGDRSRVYKGRLGRLQLPQPDTEVVECRLGVAGADLPGVAEGALLVVTDE
jgi:hypothetical protein